MSPELFLFAVLLLLSFLFLLFFQLPFLSVLLALFVCSCLSLFLTLSLQQTSAKRKQQCLTSGKHGRENNSSVGWLFSGNTTRRTKTRISKNVPLGNWVSASSASERSAILAARPANAVLVRRGSRFAARPASSAAFERARLWPKVLPPNIQSYRAAWGCGMNTRYESEVLQTCGMGGG